MEEDKDQKNEKNVMNSWHFKFCDLLRIEDRSIGMEAMEPLTTPTMNGCSKDEIKLNRVRSGCIETRLVGTCQTIFYLARSIGFIGGYGDVCATCDVYTMLVGMYFDIPIPVQPMKLSLRLACWKMYFDNCKF